MASDKAVEARHTPGPWAIDSRNGSCYVVAPDAATTVAEVKLPTDEQGDADARLIAAAPDLLAALKAVVTPQAGGAFRNLTGENAMRALDAIQKAEGR